MVSQTLKSKIVAMNSLHVGVQSWTIQDGNYPDLRIGDVCHFALEFFPNSWGESQAASIACSRSAGSNYQVTARPVFVTPSVVVLDFGWLAFRQMSPPKWIKAGKCIEADVQVEIDPFFYREELRVLGGMPELRYDFRVLGIELDNTPWISAVDADGRTIQVRDESQRSYLPVAETDAWSDDDGNAHYILEVERIEGDAVENGSS